MGGDFTPAQLNNLTNPFPDFGAIAVTAPTLPEHITASEIDDMLDRLALEIAVSKHGRQYESLYRWLEAQQHKIDASTDFMASIQQRVKRLHNRMAA